MNNVNTLTLRQWFITGLSTILLGYITMFSALFIFSSHDIEVFGGFLTIIGLVVTCIYIPTMLLGNKFHKTITNRITYLFENQIITEQQKMLLCKASAYIKLISIINTTVGVFFIGSFLGFFLRGNSFINSISFLQPLFAQVLLNIDLVLTIEGFGSIILLSIFVYSSKAMIFFILLLVFSLLLIFLGPVLLTYKEWIRKLHLLLTPILAIFFPLGTALSLFEIYILTRNEIYILFEKTPKKIVSERFFKTYLVKGREQSKKISKHSSLYKHTIDRIVIINGITACMYFIIGIPLLFGFNKYIIPTFSFVPILFSESSVGLCITAVSILLVVGTYKLSIQKILSEKLALILSLIQFFMIPCILALESNLIVLMQDVISVFLSLFFRNAQIGTFQMFLILVLIGYPFAVLSSIMLLRVNNSF